MGNWSGTYELSVAQVIDVIDICRQKDNDAIAPHESKDIIYRNALQGYAVLQNRLARAPSSAWQNNSEKPVGKEVVWISRTFWRSYAHFSIVDLATLHQLASVPRTTRDAHLAVAEKFGLVPATPEVFMHASYHDWFLPAPTTVKSEIEKLEEIAKRSRTKP